MTRIAFIGLGTMGFPMATNLLRAGLDVIAYNRSPAKPRQFAERGGQIASTIADAVARASVVITMLPDSADVSSVVTGPGGVLEHASPGTLLIDMSTIAPDVSRQLAERSAAHGVAFVDAPVSGGERGAVEGTLSIMIGGTVENFVRSKEVLSPLATSIVHVGPVGAGELVKAANQLLVAGNIQLLAEAMVFLSKHEIPLAPAIAVIRGGLAGSTVIERKSNGMLAEDFTPSFTVDLHHKDLGIFQDAARAVGSVSPLGAVVAQLMASLRAQGHGQLDHSALLLAVLELSGIDQHPSLSPLE